MRTALSDTRVIRRLLAAGLVALAADEQALGADHWRVATVLLSLARVDNLSTVLADGRQRAEATALAARAHRIRAHAR